MNYKEFAQRNKDQKSLRKSHGVFQMPSCDVEHFIEFVKEFNKKDNGMTLTIDKTI